MTEARVTQVHTEVASENDASARVTQVNAEVASVSDSTVQVRVTQINAEAAAVSDSSVQARVTNMFVEVLTSIPFASADTGVGALVITGYAPDVYVLGPSTVVIPQLFVQM